MNSRVAERGIEENPQIALKVLESQVGQLYSQSWVGLVGVLVVAVSICFALWQFLPSWKLILWVGIFTLVTIARGYLVVSFRRIAPVGDDIKKWAKWHVAGTSASGLLWAFPSLFLWPENYPEYCLVLAVCVLPLSASAVSTYYTWKPSYCAFIVLSVFPIAFRFFSEGGLTYTVLGCLALFYIVVLVQAGRLIHNSSLQTLIVGYRNEALSSFLSEEKAKQEELTDQLQIAHDQLENISLTDELTGLWNRRYLKTIIHEYVAHVLRDYHNFSRGLDSNRSGNTDIAFILIDLDHFKVVNDTHGHCAGDLVLKQASQLLKNICRETDTAIRWGGEEFLIIAHHVHRENYTILVERIRQAVESTQFDIGKELPLHLTCSIGTAVYPFRTSAPNALSWEKVLDLADTCLYAAKRSTRNAWVSINSTDLISSEDLTPNLVKHVQEHINNGKLEIESNLRDDIDICWFG